MKAMSSILLAATFLIVSHSVIAQNSVELSKGDKHFDQFEFPEALYFYEMANEQLPNSPAILRRIADTYRRMGELSLSTEWYRRTLEADASNPEDMLHYAEALKSIKEYEVAIEWYEKYAEAKPSDRRALSHIQDKYYFEDLQMDSLKYEMKKLKINNADPAIGICLFENEKYLISAVNIENNTTSEGMMEQLPYLDVYACDVSADNELINPIRLPKEVNSKFHDGPAYYNFKERTLYITRNNIRNGKPVRDKNGSVNLKIYSSKFDGTAWSNAQELKFNSDEFSNGHPCLSKDGNTMFFVSNRLDGYGGTDIYVCAKLAGAWSEPSNLGSSINTEGDEMFPFISDDGRLFFSSSGHAGLGGMDIFTSSKREGVWSRPSNLGFPINSHQDDFGMVYDSERENGFFCSNRDGQNNDDLFSFSLIKLEKMIVAGTIRSSLPQISLANERIKIQTINTGITTEKNLDANEAFSYEASPGDQIEIHLANAEYFDTDESVFRFEVPQPLNDPYVNLGEKEAEFKKLPPIGTGTLADLVRSSDAGGNKGALSEFLAKQGLSGSGQKSSTGEDAQNDNDQEDESSGDQKKNPSELLSVDSNSKGNKKDSDDSSISEKPKQQNQNNTQVRTSTNANMTGDVTGIIFDFDKSTFRDESKDILNEIVTRMKSDPSTKIKIDAHCDSRGTKGYNEELSKERASNVKRYLVKNGIQSSRIKIKWYGEEKLKNQCDDRAQCSPAEHEINRRAELTIETENFSENNK